MEFLFMADRIGDVERYQLLWLGAELRLAQERYAVCQARIWRAYNIGPEDSVNSDTGIITRASAKESTPEQ